MSGADDLPAGLTHVGAGVCTWWTSAAKPAVRRRAVARATRPDGCGDGGTPAGAAKRRRARHCPARRCAAAKRTSDLILRHPLPLSFVDVRVEVRGDGVEIEATAETVAQTGVEMEALVAASVAAPTVYDMAKAVDPGMSVESVHLAEKTKEQA